MSTDDKTNPPTDNAPQEADIVDESSQAAESAEAIDAEVIEDPSVDGEVEDTGGDADGLFGPLSIIIGMVVVVAILIAFLNRNNDAQDRADTPDSGPEVAQPLELDAYGRPLNAEPEGDDEAVMAVAADGDADEATTTDANAETDTTEASAAPVQSALLARAEAMASTNGGTEAAPALVEDAAEEVAEQTEELADTATEAVAETLAAVTTSAVGTASDALTATDEAITETADEVSDDIAEVAAETVEVIEEETVEIITTTEEISAPETTDTAEVSITEETPAEPTDIVADASEAAEATGDIAAATPEEVTDLVEEAAEETVVTVAETAEEVAETITSLALPTDIEDTAAEVTDEATDVVEETTTITSATSPAAEEQLEARLDDIKSDVKADVLAETEEKINQALEQTKGEVAELRTELSEQTELQKEANQRLADLSTQLETIQSDDLSAQRNGTLLLALSNLSAGVASGDPFSLELDAVEQLAPNARRLSMLRQYSNEGLVSDTTLRADYQSAARAALSNEKRENADGAMGRFFANISSLVTVRPIGDVEGDTLSAIIARAEDRLMKDDLSAALLELDSLDGAARDAFSDWIDAAKARVEAQNRIEELEKALNARAG